jgi:hypothetical protein
VRLAGDSASNIEKMTREFGLVGWTKYGGQVVFLLFLRSPMRYFYFIRSTLAAGRQKLLWASRLVPLHGILVPPCHCGYFRSMLLHREVHPKPATVAEHAWLRHRAQGFQLYQLPQRIWPVFSLLRSSPRILCPVRSTTLGKEGVEISTWNEMNCTSIV